MFVIPTTVSIPKLRWEKLVTLHQGTYNQGNSEKKFYFSFKKSLRWYDIIGSGTNWMQSGGHGDNHRGKFKKIYFWNRLLKWEDTQPHAQYDLKHLLYAPIICWATYREPLIWDTQIWISLSSSNPPCIYSPWRSIAQWEVVEHVPHYQDVIGLKSNQLLFFYPFWHSALRHQTGSLWRCNFIGKLFGMVYRVYLVTSKLNQRSNGAKRLSRNPPNDIFAIFFLATLRWLWGIKDQGSKRSFKGNNF